MSTDSSSTFKMQNSLLPVYFHFLDISDSHTEFVSLSKLKGLNESIEKYWEYRLIQGQVTEAPTIRNRFLVADNCQDECVETKGVIASFFYRCVEAQSQCEGSHNEFYLTDKIKNSLLANENIKAGNIEKVVNWIVRNNINVQTLAKYCCVPLSETRELKGNTNFEDSNTTEEPTKSIKCFIESFAELRKFRLADLTCEETDPRVLLELEAIAKGQEDWQLNPSDTKRHKLEEGVPVLAEGEQESQCTRSTKNELDNTFLLFQYDEQDRINTSHHLFEDRMLEKGIDLVQLKKHMIKDIDNHYFMAMGTALSASRQEQLRVDFNIPDGLWSTIQSDKQPNQITSALFIHIKNTNPYMSLLDFFVVIAHSYDMDVAAKYAEKLFEAKCKPSTAVDHELLARYQKNIKEASTLPVLLNQIEDLQIKALIKDVCKIRCSSNVHETFHQSDRLYLIGAVTDFMIHQQAEKLDSKKSTNPYLIHKPESVLLVTTCLYPEDNNSQAYKQSIQELAELIYMKVDCYKVAKIYNLSERGIQQLRSINSDGNDSSFHVIRLCIAEGTFYPMKLARLLSQESIRKLKGITDRIRIIRAEKDRSRIFACCHSPLYHCVNEELVRSVLFSTQLHKCISIEELEKYQVRHIPDAFYCELANEIGYRSQIVKAFEISQNCISKLNAQREVIPREVMLKQTSKTMSLFEFFVRYLAVVGTKAPKMACNLFKRADFKKTIESLI